MQIFYIYQYTRKVISRKHDFLFIAPLWALPIFLFLYTLNKLKYAFYGLFSSYSIDFSWFFVWKNWHKTFEIRYKILSKLNLFIQENLFDTIYYSKSFQKLGREKFIMYITMDCTRCILGKRRGWIIKQIFGSGGVYLQEAKWVCVQHVVILCIPILYMR